MEATSLDKLKCGQCAEVISVNADESIRRRLFDIGLISKTRLYCVGESPFGDPHAYLIRDAVIALRNEDAKLISVQLSKEDAHGTDS